MEIVGKMDRPRKQITVAQKFGLECMRFTLSHEIAHFVLHKDLELHREFVVGSNSASRPSPLEREANLFGAELLMPSRLVRKEFLKRFKGTIDGSQMSDQIHYWLSLGNGEIDKEALRADLNYRAAQFARARSYFGRPIISMCEFFRVSGKALAIQLRDLELVK